MREPDIDLELLMKLRLVVARFGEMDGAQWWNSKGQLGRRGATVLRRGFPRTHRFAQARSVFALAAHRCDEIFSLGGHVTLWRLPAVVEDEFDARWEHWLDQPERWLPFFADVDVLTGGDLGAHLRSFGLVDDGHVATAARLRRSAEGRAVALPAAFAGTDDDIRLLALGFGRGEPRALAVPYARERAE
jgi:hypothetical protein